MHDVGKIGIPDSILKKAGCLDPDERQVMRTHTTIGADIIGHHAHGLLAMARNVALTHHEKWDGTGYPAGLAGEDIPFEGRIVAVVDVFDALTSRRPYKQAWPVERAVDFLRDQRGKQFDAALVDLFLSRMPDVREIMVHWADSNEPIAHAGLAAEPTGQPHLAAELPLPESALP